MARRVVELVGRVVAEDTIQSILENPRFCITLNPSHIRVHSVDLVNISDRPVEVVMENKIVDI